MVDGICAGIDGACAGVDGACAVDDPVRSTFGSDQLPVTRYSIAKISPRGFFSSLEAMRVAMPTIGPQTKPERLAAPSPRLGTTRTRTSCVSVARFAVPCT